MNLTAAQKVTYSSCSCKLIWMITPAVDKQQHYDSQATLTVCGTETNDANLKIGRTVSHTCKSKWKSAKSSLSNYQHLILLTIILQSCSQ